MTEREFAMEVVRTLQRAGFRALWAGGCVRDELLRLPPHDYDVATDATPDQVMKLFRRSLAIGAAFGVVEVIGPRGPDHKHLTVEVATFRSDGSYTDGRRPDSVVFSSPEEDAQRRDFTINGLFYDPIAEQLHDFVGGRTDLVAKVLRAIGDPMARFTEDKLRVLRAVRIAARFELTIDPGTLAAARRIAPQIAVVSAERIAEELRKLLSHSNRTRGVELLHEFGLIEVLFPELAGRVTNEAPHVASLNREASFELSLASLLHALPRQQVEVIADRLKLATAEKVRIGWLVAHQDVLRDAPTLRLSKLKPLLAHPGSRELIAMHRSLGYEAGAAFSEHLLDESTPEELDPLPLITGDDLKRLGLKPGPEFKRLLDAVREAQLDGRAHSKEDGLRLVRERLPHPPA
jgi:poly(A) polymerase